ncbi:D-glycero-beta-D-manno-heptose 1-phosphate adenylyltransferase [Sphingobacteriales bacterium UPWRP_1]|nr:D-glycero-beta-D-manno-heptose 1-phosphate adenylyltransferase [Sphingobacteriales bacterium TSM_CSM]PSJ77061.1 D-glycero-beta-D-manno-heptose 1-phosphate adenylyltransferase [Sphingobacteriales bacterium UPWRP_1]
MTILEQVEHKVLTPQQLQFKLAQWRFKDQKIVFTNGCFDLLHLGHIYTLTQAAQNGQVLVIGLNSDASVKRLKGNKRPLQTQQTRALILASLSFVTAVVVFDEDTPYNLIAQILPDVLVKGGDYTKNQIAGADIVEQNGGSVVIVPYLQGYSTSGLLGEG